MFFPLIVLLLGIVEFSRVFSLQLRLQQAAREAAREIALHYDDPGSPPDPDAIINDLVGSGINRTIVGCTSPDDVTTVTLDDAVDLAVPLVGGSLPAVDIAARARMPCEG